MEPKRSRISRSTSPTSAGSPTSSSTARQGASSSASTTGAPAGTRRGRPLKEDDPDPVAERRRARVRQAQHALRMRKEAAFGSLEQRVKSLQDTVESMSNAFMEFNDHYMGTDLPQSFPEVTSNLMTTLDRFLTLAREATREGAEQDQSDQQGSSNTGSSPSATRTAHQHTSSAGLEPSALAPTSSESPEGRPEDLPALVRVRSQYQIFTSDALATQSSAAQSDDVAVSPPANLDMTMNYNMNFGLWREAFNPWRTAAISPDIVTFLAADKQSFAAHLLYICMVRAYLLLRDKSATGSDAVQTIFRYRVRFESLDAALDSIQKALYYMRCLKPPIIVLGEATEAAFTPSALRMTTEPFDNVSIEKSWLDRAISNMLPSIGEDPAEYLSAWEVELYLAEKWSMDLTLSKSDTADIPSPSTQFIGLAISEPVSTAPNPATSTTSGFDPSMDFEYNLSTSSSVPSSTGSFNPSQFSMSAIASPIEPRRPQQGRGQYTQATSMPPPRRPSQPIQTTLQSTFSNRDIHTLVQRLCLVAVSFGNGPRFHQSAVDSVVHVFMQQHWSAS